MTISLMMTLHDRPPEVMRSVFAALKYFPGNQEYDELVLVNDRGDRAPIEEALAAVGLTARIVEVEGQPGYRGQAIAWNAGYRTIESDYALCISSDCILQPWSVRTFRLWAEALPSFIIYGKAVHCGKGYMSKFNSVPPIITKTICSSKLNMPETYAWMAPMDTIRALGGWDEEFSAGLCYDHTDLFYRLIKAGNEVVICDDIVALHVEHERGYMDLAKVERNHALFESKHGKYKPNGWAELVNERMACIGADYPPATFFVARGREDSVWETAVQRIASGYEDVLPLPFPELAHA